MTGFWYEKLPNGRFALCFRSKAHGRRFTQRLLLPEGVKELEPVENQTCFCTLCQKGIEGSIGVGDGTGRRFAHPECFDGLMGGDV